MLSEYYKNKESQLQEEYAQIRSWLRQILMIRLTVFAVATMTVYLLWSSPLWVVLTIVVCALAVFLLFVKRNERLLQLEKINLVWQELVQNEQASLRGDLSSFDGGMEFNYAAHPFAHDLDIFGERSLFQALNRTATAGGKSKLAEILSQGVKDVKSRQNAIRELSNSRDFAENFTVFGKLSEIDPDERQFVDRLFQQDNRSLNGLGWKVYPWLITVVSCMGLILWSVGLVSFTEFLFWSAVPLVVTAIMLKTTNTIYLTIDRGVKVLGKYGKLLNLIESHEFDSVELRTIKQNLLQSGWNSDELKRLDDIMNGFDSRANPFVGILLNLFLAWDVRVRLRLERWLQNHADSLDKLFDSIAHIDALNSMGTFAFNHPNYSWPTEGEGIISATELGHPSIPENSCVRNDIEIKGKGDFKIITGANMAGKSTFLRAVGVSYVMAKAGLPVYARGYSFRNIQLFTSMRTTDSLQDNESYFYTELKRLKQIVNALQEKGELLIILDEILKGTNSKDKAEGSKRFVRKLVREGGAGIVATHDLSLCTLSDEIESISNQCFEVEFGTNDLIFDYKIRNGVCKNMNATWLLDKMNLVDK